jgi:hypothetical protein
MGLLSPFFRLIWWTTLGELALNVLAEAFLGWMGCLVMSSLKWSCQELVCEQSPDPFAHCGQAEIELFDQYIFISLQVSPRWSNLLLISPNGSCVTLSTTQFRAIQPSALIPTG